MVPAFGKRLAYMLAASALGLAAASCGEEEYRYPSVRLEYLTAFSDAEGGLTEVCTDAGRFYPVSSGLEDVRIAPDSLLRIIGNYTIGLTAGGDSAVCIYAVGQVIAPEPRPASWFKDGVKTDEASVGSIWMGWDYLNIMLEVKAQSGTHTFGFVEDSYTVDTASGEADVRLTLYHNAGSDVQAYTRRAYLSVPLSQYASPGVERVRVTFRVNAGDEGWRSWTFEYKPR